MSHPPPSAPPRQAGAARLPAEAYLVVHRGVRWTDVYRLSGGRPVTLGRSSASEVVLKSTLASRQHARIRPAEAAEAEAFAGPETAAQPGRTTAGWILEDLNSRNGVSVNGRRLQEAHPLREGDHISIAGFEIQFTESLARVTPPPHAATQEDQATGEDLDQSFAQTAGPSDSADVVLRLTGSDLMRSPGLSASAAMGPSERRLLQMAFAMGRVEESDEATEIFLSTIQQLVPDAVIGLYLSIEEASVRSVGQAGTLSGGAADGLALPQYVRHRQHQRYRRPPQALIRQILTPGAPAVLARNVMGDRALATADTQGEIDVESILLAPLRWLDTTVGVTPREGRGEDPPPGATRPTGERAGDLSPEDPGSKPPIGWVHVTTAAGDRPLDESDLHAVVTAGEILSEALLALVQRRKLQSSLHRSQQTIRQLHRQLAGRVRLVGRSEPIRMISRQIAQVAPTDAGVLVRGESGTGKELVASAIHYASDRRDAPLVCLNCAALSKDLLESELFGHERGAFTGATDQKKGKFEAASDGTLMLDEIGEMSLDLQAKLLRVLEGHPFERVGGQTPIRVDVRVVAATHRDLAAMVAEKQFREDLYYRLHVVEILVPPLRERGQDVILLARHFLTQFTESMGRPAMQLSEDAERKLLAHRWPGNVRELRNVIERAVVMAGVRGEPVGEMGADELMLTRGVQDARGGGSATTAAAGATESGNFAPPIETSLSDLERLQIERVLRHTDGNKSRAAAILGIERSTLDRKLKRYARS